jgi:hypothetical protein
MGQIVEHLEVEPELRGGVERLREQPRGGRRDAALSIDDLVDVSRRDAEVGGKPSLGDGERLEEVLEQDLAGVRWILRDGTHELSPSAMVVGHANVVRLVAAPAEDDAPLVVDADGVVTGEVPGESLEAIVWRAS